MSEHTPTSDTEAAPETGYVPGNDFTECVREGCPAFHHQYGDRLYFQSRNAPLGVHGTPPCASCGEPSIHRIILRGDPTPVCLRHLNHWRTPGVPETVAPIGGAASDLWAGVSPRVCDCADEPPRAARGEGEPT